MTTHARLAPSSASRWAGQCPGSVVLEEANRETEQSPEAMEGDAAHHIVATVLRGGSAPSVGSAAPNGVVIDDEMLEAAEVFIDDVQTRAAGHTLHIEERVFCSQIHADNDGTPDVWWFIPQGAGGVLFVDDFKYGHRFVDAFENWQLIDYVAGIMNRPEFRNVDMRELKVVLTVCQPRNFHVLGPIRRWATDGFTLTDYFQTLRDAAYEALGNNPSTNVGPECRDCTGRHQCTALQNAADSVADIAGTIATMELPPVALGVELRMLERAAKLLDARLTGLREQALVLKKKGTPIPFWELKQGEGRERWTKPVEDIMALGALVGHDLTKPKPITPNQARKLGVDADVVAAYSERPKGELKLIPVTDANARKVFSQ